VNASRCGCTERSAAPTVSAGGQKYIVVEQRVQ
jgi:hypothetical protein